MAYLSLSSIKKHFSTHKEIVEKIEYIFGFLPDNSHLYELAFRHKSAAVIQNEKRISNERLEFLGDAVLGVIVADYLFRKYPYENEGFLTELRSKIVSRTQLNDLAIKLGFKELMKTDIPHNNVGMSIYGDAFEALIGAIYLDQGYKFTKEIVFKYILTAYLDIDQIEITEVNFKSKLIIWAQKLKKEFEFKVEKQSINKHSRLYHIAVYIDHIKVAEASSTSIKKAEQIAAKHFMNSISDEKG